MGPSLRFIEIQPVSLISSALFNSPLLLAILQTWKFIFFSFFPRTLFLLTRLREFLPWAGELDIASSCHGPFWLAAGAILQGYMSFPFARWIDLPATHLTQARTISNLSLSDRLPAQRK